MASLDIAIWDAYSKAANLPLAVLLGGSLNPLQAYNSRGLWLISLDEIEKEFEIEIDENTMNWYISLNRILKLIN